MQQLSNAKRERAKLERAARRFRDQASRADRKRSKRGLAAGGPMPILTSKEIWRMHKQDSKALKEKFKSQLMLVEGIVMEKKSDAPTASAPPPQKSCFEWPSRKYHSANSRPMPLRI